MKEGSSLSSGVSNSKYFEMYMNMQEEMFSEIENGGRRRCFDNVQRLESSVGWT
jgi:hypothetical protein